MEVYVIRHTPVAVGKDICYGQSNVPVADSFLKDIEHYETLLHKHFDTVYCSPLDRCKNLATALQIENVIFTEALLEMNFGDWENRSWSMIEQEELNKWMADFVNTKTPNGENLLNLYERVRVFIDNLRLQIHQNVLLITHAGVIRCLWAYLLEISLSNIFRIPVGYGEIFIFNLAEDRTKDSIRQLK